MGKKSNEEDHCTRQKHIMHEEAEEKGTPRRGDRCWCQTRCTQTQNVRTLPSSVNDSTDSPTGSYDSPTDSTDSTDSPTDSTDSTDSATDSTDSPTDSTDHHTYWQFD